VILNKFTIVFSVWHNFTFSSGCELELENRPKFGRERTECEFFLCSNLSFVLLLILICLSLWLIKTLLDITYFIIRLHLKHLYVFSPICYKLIKLTGVTVFSEVFIYFVYKSWFNFLTRILFWYISTTCKFEVVTRN